MRIREYINGIEGVVANGTAVANIPTNRRYHGLKIIATGTDGTDPYTDPADIVSKLRLIVNGVVIRDVTPTQLRKLAVMNGQTVGNNEIPIFFSEPWRASVLGEESTSWDLFNQAKCTLEIDFKSGVTSPAVKVRASYDYARNISDGKPFLAIIKQLTFNYNLSSGKSDIINLPAIFPVQRALLQASAGTITDLEVTRDGIKVFEGSYSENLRELADYGLDGSQFSFAAVFDNEQQISSPLVIEREWNVRPTCSEANTVSVLLEHRANGYK